MSLSNFFSALNSAQSWTTQSHTIPPKKEWTNTAKKRTTDALEKTLTNAPEENVVNTHTKASASTTIPKMAAKTTLLSPHDIFSKEQLPMYLFWLRNVKKTGSDPHFPTPIEYHEFIKWHTPKVTSIPSKRCKDKRHPWDNISIATYCPVCTVDIHIRFVMMVKEAWEKVSGPWTRPVQIENDQSYPGLRLAYRYARCQLANAVLFSERLQMNELEWDAKNPNVNVSDCYSNGKALDIASQKTSDLGLWGIDLIDIREDRIDRGQHPEKTVRFAPDTSDNCSDNSRQQAQFRRNSPQYKPGKHAYALGPKNYSWANSLHADLDHCKLFLVDSPAEMEELTPDPSKQEGLLGGYKYASLVHKALRRTRSEGDEETKVHLVQMMRVCDAVLVRRPIPVKSDEGEKMMIEEVRLFVWEMDLEVSIALSLTPVRPSSGPVISLARTTKRTT
ncbi:hypothetical protein K504DRAFT_464671 [Pleomassaria siparia CBS 279.74]|uniref:Uncharacterized protein n=1 Tax=Pleomassaria siparia CBS 279.74 TaxID=1314801 RepID=A0A6G1KJD6_9PLEO|nr:hypothetical protein K504DRAFT_464671 [Pleomassaria siparia CBS 279.74]